MVTKKRQGVAMGVWVYSGKGTYAEKTFTPAQNETNEKLRGTRAARSESCSGELSESQTATRLCNRCLTGDV